MQNVDIQGNTNMVTDESFDILYSIINRRRI